MQKVRESLFLRVEAFAKENTLNVYKRARLGNQVKWALREPGYRQEFRQSFTHEIVTVVSVVNARRKSAAPKS